MKFSTVLCMIIMVLPVCTYGQSKGSQARPDIQLQEEFFGTPSQAEAAKPAYSHIRKSPNLFLKRMINPVKIKSMPTKVEKGGMASGYLYYALVAFIVALGLYFIAWLTGFPAFSILGTIAAVVAIVFLILWMLQQV